MTVSRRALAVSLLALAPAVNLYARSAAAADCAPIVEAEMATLEAPGFRQYMSSTAAGTTKERLLSVALGDTVYIAMGGQRWQKMDRKEIIATAKEAAADADYRDCRSLGSQPVGAVAAEGYAFTLDSKSHSFPSSRAKVWIGADGHVLKQATDNGTLRYEYDNVTPPIP